MSQWPTAVLSARSKLAVRMGIIFLKKVELCVRHWNPDAAWCHRGESRIAFSFENATWTLFICCNVCTDSHLQNVFVRWLDNSYRTDFL